MLGMVPMSFCRIQTQLYDTVRVKYRGDLPTEYYGLSL